MFKSQITAEIFYQMTFVVQASSNRIVCCISVTILVYSLRSAVPMINNNQEPPFIECSLWYQTLASSQNHVHKALLA